MVKTFDCTNCGGHHPRPINRNCKEDKVNKEKPMDMNAQILHELKTLGARMADIEDKLHSIEYQKSSGAFWHTFCFQDQQRTTCKLENLQSEVDSRIKELQRLSAKGKCNSQRGGSAKYWL